MKCYGCGHDFPNTSSRCPRCHRSTSPRGRTSTDSRLLEFPRRTRVAPPESAARPVPAWRTELNERVRAIRANRNGSSSPTDASVEELAKSVDSEARVGDGGGDLSFHAATARVEPGPPQYSTAIGDRRSSNIIVEAALTRVRRASEIANRAALPKIEPARSIQASTQGALAVDRQATARALEPSAEIVVSRVDPTPAPRPEVFQPRPEVFQPIPEVIKAPVTETANVEASSQIPNRVEATVSVESAVSQTSYADESIDISSLPIIDDLEPLDYLEAEVRKVGKALNAEFQRNESPTIVTHAVIGMVDLLVVAVSSSPFLAFVRIFDGSFSITQTRIASGAIVALIAFFYLSLTHCLCGKTFGMMLTNTRIVEAHSFGPLSPSQALLRAAGYFVAAAPAMVGLVWAAIDQKHRGWHDFISGTVVVRDF